MKHKHQKYIEKTALALAHMSDEERYRALSLLLESMVAYADSESAKRTLKAVVRERFGGCDG